MNAPFTYASPTLSVEALKQLAARSPMPCFHWVFMTT
ncbi:MAG: hypothetical protein H6R25_601 [Proteobacteria bacterium]|nr:hypothetical protein [Pseudomonadota bacterium]